MPRLRVELLGMLRVTLDGVAADAFGYDKVRALLAYLAVERDRPHSRAALAELFWPEQPAQTARASLRRALAALRHALGDRDTPRPLVLADRATLQLNPAADIDVDALEFQALVAACDAHHHAASALCAPCAARLERAAVLHRGDFLALLSLPDSAAFEEWVAVRRERLHDQAIAVLARLAAHYDAVGDNGAARDAAARWATLARWDEAAYRHLMRLYARAGQRSAALAQYERCRSLLASELGLEPAPETVALHAAIRDGQIDATGPAQQRADVTPLDPPALPEPPNRLIGRERELAELDALLADGRARLITIVGPPGVGKTRVGLAIARECAMSRSYRDGVWYVPLASLADHALVARAILRGCGIAEGRGQAPELTLAAAFAARHALLLLDNFEQLVAAAKIIATLLAAAPALTIVVTSRTRLRISAEHVYALEPFASPSAHSDRWPQLAEHPAVRLFADRARAADRRFVLDERSATWAAAICRQLDGLPLAIELAAARTRLFDLAELSAHLARDGLELLTDGARDLPERQRTLFAAIAWSVELLPAAARRLLLCLGVFAGSFTIDAAAAVGAEAAQVEPTAELLSVLVEQSLVQRQPARDGPARLALLDTIRSFAVARLGEDGGLAAAQARHAAYLTHMAETIEPALFDWRQRDALDRLEAEHDNILAALSWGTSANACDATPGELRPAVVALRLAWVMAWEWLLRGSTSEGILWLRRVIAATEDVAGIERGQALGALGGLEALDGQLDQAELHLRSSLGIGDALGHRATAFHARWMLSFVAWCRGDVISATAHADECLCLAPQLGAFQQAVALFQRGRVAAVAGDAAGAKTWLEEALSRMRALGATWWEGDILLNIGLAALFAADLERARASFAESLILARQARAPDVIASALYNLAELAQLEGRYDEAIAVAADLARFWQTRGEEAMCGEVIVLCAKIDLDCGAFERARERCDAALAIGRRLGAPVVVAQALLVRGRAWLAEGDLLAAQICQSEAATAVRASGSRDTEIMELSLAGLVASYAGDHAGARACAARRRVIVDGLQRLDERADALCEYGQVELAAGAAAAAGASLIAGIAIYGRMRAPGRVAWALERLAMCVDLCGGADGDALCYAAAHLRRTTGAGAWPIDAPLRERWASMSSPWGSGEEPDLDQIVGMALTIWQRRAPAGLEGPA